MRAVLVGTRHGVFDRGNNNYPCVVSVRNAEAIWLGDAGGKRHADSYGNNALQIGYRHPALIDAQHKQLDQLTFTARGVTSETSIELGEALPSMWGAKAKVSLAPSGGDANDAASCVAKANTGRYKTDSCYDAFHGRSRGTLSVGSHFSDRRKLGPAIPGILKVPPPYRHGNEHLGFDEEAYARHALNAVRHVFEYEREIAALAAETIRNEAHPPPDWYWAEGRVLCAAYGAPMIMDEIATRLGKTGWSFNRGRRGFGPLAS